MPESVHLCDFPKYHAELQDEDLEASMECCSNRPLVWDIRLRKENKLKVRQPLGKAHIASSDAELMAFLKHQQHLIADELNVKEVEFVDDETTICLVKSQAEFPHSRKKSWQVDESCPRSDWQIQSQ